MYVIFDETQAEKLKEKYTVLRLDRVYVEEKDMHLQLFCVVGAGSISLDQIITLESDVNLHEKMIDNLQKQNYDFVAQSIEHLKGKFGGEIDSFYDEVSKRIII